MGFFQLLPNPEGKSVYGEIQFSDFPCIAVDVEDIDFRNFVRDDQEILTLEEINTEE